MYDSVSTSTALVRNRSELLSLVQSESGKSRSESRIEKNECWSEDLERENQVKEGENYK